LGLVKRWGPERVEAACGRALEAEAISVGLIGRMIERATEDKANGEAAGEGPLPAPTPARFAREPEHFATSKRRKAPDGEAQGQLHGNGGAA
jgi:hypothetical protein